MKKIFLILLVLFNFTHADTQYLELVKETMRGIGSGVLAGVAITIANGGIEGIKGASAAKIAAGGILVGAGAAVPAETGSKEPKVAKGVAAVLGWEPKVAKGVAAVLGWMGWMWFIHLF